MVIYCPVLCFIFFWSDSLVSDKSECSYSQLSGLATDEGKPVGFQSGVTPDACQTLCDNNDRCESISMCDTSTQGIKDCYLKDKKIISSEPVDENRATCVTAYKNCEKGIA